MIGIRISSNISFEGYPSGIQGPETQYYSHISIAIAAQKGKATGMSDEFTRVKLVTIITLSVIITGNDLAAYFLPANATIWLPSGPNMP